jgi:transketolase
MTNREIDNLCINTVGFLGIDMINKAKSGHPGIVLGCAPIVFTLFTKHLKFVPQLPCFIDRDRFVLSAGHGSALLYSILHLCQFNISIDDLKNFRGLGITPGHPEVGTTPGVEATTGPLGQGIGNGVGMAIAETILANRFNKPNFPIVDHKTYVLCGDGDLQEGVSWEAISLAGHLKLNKLILLFDSNDIQLDGETNLATSDNYKMKFEACGWNHILVEQGGDIEKISESLTLAGNSVDKPTIIEFKTIIGRGSLFQNTSKVHGAPLDNEDILQMKNKVGYSLEPFYVPEIVTEQFKTYLSKNCHVCKHTSILSAYSEAYPDEFKLLEKIIFNDEKIEIDHKYFEELIKKPFNSTRNVIGEVIKVYSSFCLNLVGGSADLTSSTKAKGADGNYSFKNRGGRNINYGVREHAMGTISNGILLHGGLKTFTGTFFSFSDYMKPAIRIAAISKLPNIFIFTHDSIAVGEDGPTHQPIEQLTSLRCIPDLNVFRPCDTKETLGAFSLAINYTHKPSSIVLTRQDLPNLTNSLVDISCGAYIIDHEDKERKLDIILLSCGSEVSLCLDAKKIFSSLNIRVVSIPSIHLFESQSEKYKKKILPNRNITIAVEAGSPEIWYKYAKYVYGIESFGESASIKVILERFGFSKEKLSSYICNIL